MDIDAKITAVHQRSAKTLLQLQALTVEGQAIQARIAACQAELVRLDGEERAWLAVKAEGSRAE